MDQGKSSHERPEASLAEALQKQNQLLTKLESVNQQLKDFAYIVSHDLKAPLRGIKTLVEWIVADYADKLDENGRTQMDMLTKSVDRMHNLIEGVLQFSRAGQRKEEPANVNLNELVPQIIESLEPPQNISIAVENDLPVVTVELNKVTQVFQNLLSNALQYIDKPQGKIQIDCTAEDGFWKFAITDNGPGIEEKHFERIFQMFRTLSPRDDSESTGAGLTVAKRIVEFCGGAIWVESNVGRGSTFFFTLPRQEVDAKNA